MNGNLPSSNTQHPVYHKIGMLRGAISELCLYKLGLMMKNVFQKLKHSVLSSFGMSNWCLWYPGTNYSFWNLRKEKSPMGVGPNLIFLLFFCCPCLL